MNDDMVYILVPWPASKAEVQTLTRCGLSLDYARRRTFVVCEPPPNAATDDRLAETNGLPVALVSAIAASDSLIVPSQLAFRLPSIRAANKLVVWMDLDYFWLHMRLMQEFDRDAFVQRSFRGGRTIDPAGTIRHVVRTKTEEAIIKRFGIDAPLVLGLDAELPPEPR